MQSPERRSAAYYSARIDEFLTTSANEIIGELTTRSIEVDSSQVFAWTRQIDLLRHALAEIDGHLSFEFDIPRLGSRIDAVVLSQGAIVPIEFKVGAKHFLRADEDQAWDYALDLKNFHRGSHNSRIFPILVATDAKGSDSAWAAMHQDGVYRPRHVNADGLRDALADAIKLSDALPIDGHRWVREAYHPTPTIIQAARTLYSRHSVEAISRSDASAKNLGTTSKYVEEVITRAQAEGWKAIVFVTGVPGAGKTLVGLNIATRHRRSHAEDPAHAVFLSGNGPLVAVLRAALARDELARSRANQVKLRKGDVEQPIKQFIQNVHHFRDEALRSEDPPVDNVVVFDEAQRAWNQPKTAKFLNSIRRKQRIQGFSMSEPEFHLAYLDRKEDWAVAVCLVGGGQEIHDGEAGITEWIRAVRKGFPEWRVFISSRLVDSEYAAGEALASLEGHAHVSQHDDLHLAVSMRSFRAERVSGFVKAVLDRDVATARSLYSELRPRYPLVMSRDLAKAKRWIQDHARGSERTGLVASSSAERLKPHAIDVRVAIDPVHWFLDDRDDTRSSYYLEDAATEFQVQGLELDWVCATWDADLRIHQGDWLHRRFTGSRWNQVKKPELQQYLVNAYRVLLTRARQGMAIFIPPGDSDDSTRLPEFYNETWEYLRDIGVHAI